MKSNPKGAPRPSTPGRDRKSKATKAPSARSKSKILTHLGAEDGRHACEGVLLGLYRAERQQVSELLEWIPDGMAEFAHEPLQALAPARQRQLPGTQESVCKELRAFARRHLPEWKWLQK